MAVLVGKKAPLFESDAVVNGGEFVEKFSLEQYIGKKHVIFFFYPLDFPETFQQFFLASVIRVKIFTHRGKKAFPVRARTLLLLFFTFNAIHVCSWTADIMNKAFEGRMCRHPCSFSDD